MKYWLKQNMSDFPTLKARAKALDDVNLKVRKGDFLAIIGQNGSGKTTLVKNIVALLETNRRSSSCGRIGYSQFENLAIGGQNRDSIPEP